MLAYARAEAMRRGARVAVCPSTDGANCTGANWGAGMIVFADVDQGGTVNDAQDVLRIIPALSGGNTIAATGFASNYVHFRGSGIATPSGSLKLCDDRPAQGRIIAISPTGSIKMTKDVTCP
jgi:type IV fimbrial biogenesis protein FimT